MERIDLCNVDEIKKSPEVKRVAEDITSVIVKHTFENRDACHAGLCLALASYCKSFMGPDGIGIDPQVISGSIHCSVDEILLHDFMETMHGEIHSDENQ